jgi:glycosyltransferase involved in cell wall biosynthesis
MKVIFDVEHPYAWAHGGCQILVEKLMKYLPHFGVAVEPLRWWDEQQKGDILNIFYWPTPVHELAKQKGIKVVSWVFLDTYTSKGALNLYFRKQFISVFRTFFRQLSGKIGWELANISDAFLFPSEYDKQLSNYLFSTKIDKSFVILHGVDEQYLVEPHQNPHNADFLVCVATIDPRKNILLLVRLAKELKIPVVFIGKPYADNAYFQSFLNNVDNKYVIYKGYLEEQSKLEYLKKAKGFVLLSKAESGCIAVLEALATRCPVFLPDFSWAKNIYKGYATFGNCKDYNKLKSSLRDFYDNAHNQPNDFPVLSWENVAKRYFEMYKKVLS